MESLPAGAATTESPASPAETRGPPAPRVSDRLTPDLIDPAADAGADRRPGRTQRHDGWTPERIRIFLEALAECGVVADAARAAGMSPSSAHRLRNRTANRAFHLAWCAAERLARRRISSMLMSRAIHGCVELTVRDGKVCEERHRFDNRLTMAVLERLDHQALVRDCENSTVGVIANEFDRFLDIVCDEGRGAAEFIAAREDEFACSSAARDARHLLRRADNYREWGAALADEIDLSDLDPRQAMSWDTAQWKRACESGLLGQIVEAYRSEENCSDPMATALEVWSCPPPEEPAPAAWIKLLVAIAEAHARGSGGDMPREGAAATNGGSELQ